MSEFSLRRALVVGSGSIAKRHIKNLRQQFPGANVMCVSSSGRAISASDVGATEVLPDLATAIGYRPDLAIVASPAPYHLQHADKLLTANIPVLIEKPLCARLSELKAINLQERQVGMGVAYNLRYMPAARIVKTLLDDAAVGSISTAFAEVGQYLPDWRPDSNYREGVSASKALGGGALLELSHELDYLSWFFGPFSRVLGVTRRVGQLDIDVDDSVDALLEKKDGLLVHVHLDFLQRQPCRHFKAIGDLGTIVWDLIDNTVQILRPEGAIEQVYSDSDYDRNQMYVEQLFAFVQSIEGTTCFESSLGSGISVMKLIESIKLSSEKSMWIALEQQQ